MSERPLISIAIPARDQRQRLADTLDSIARSDFDLDQVEVVVVDDGSSDGTYEAFRGRRYPFAFRIARVEHANQSATTNEAIRLSRGELVLCSAQDILFDRNLLREHAAWHEHFAGEEIAVLGYLPYAPQLDVNPFMVYLVTGGFQFAYYLIKDPLRVPPNFVYAPNFSVRREVLHRVGLFDPQFPFGCQDTDIGIRLAKAGVRIVYNAQAVGYHNHPMELSGFLRRQRITGGSLVRLQAKHPDHEGGLRIWDTLLEHYLGVAPVALDALLARVAQLEPEVDRHRGSYEELWSRAFAARESLDGFAPEQREIVLRVDRLFRSYNRILQYHWGQGYFEQSLQDYGPDRVREILEARLHRNQAPVQLRRAVERNLARHGIELRLVGERDYMTSIVVHDVADYRSAMLALECYLDPDSQTFNRQIVVAASAGSLSAEERRKIEVAVELVEGPTPGAALIEALARCRGDRVTLRSAGVEPGDPRGPLIVDKVLERFPQIGVLGGSVGNGRRGRVCGYRRDGSPIEQQQGAASLHPVDSVIPEYCVLRRSLLEVVLNDLSGRVDSHAASRDVAIALCGSARAAGHKVYHIPELTCAPREGVEL